MYPPTLCFYKTSANQCPGRKSKSQFRRRNKSNAKGKKQELDGRATACSMGTPHHDKIQQRRHPRREEAAIREAKSKAKMEKYYNSKVRSTSFKPGDLVYRNNDASRAEDTGNLGHKWEGSYEVTKALGKGVYKLRDRDRKQLPQTLNVNNLKKCNIHKM
ncbi:hypothetical protein Tco_0878597 [Tanacetum coccineum]|uniref:Reverse transcriptase domain-containing protein n=1 Tax=Tanacetum coccineum TaxID=301880 RepID=A0ABQ5C1S1_9ASTR